MIIHGPLHALNQFLVQWNLTDFCNYDCSYCNPVYKSGKTGFTPIELVKRVIDNILVKAHDRNVIFNFQGGEVTVHPDFLEILKYVYDSGARSITVTNAARSIAFLTKIAPFLTNLYLTFHHEQTTIEKFIPRMRVFHPSRVVVYIPMDPTRWDVCVNAVNLVQAEGYISVPKIIFTEYGSGNNNIPLAYSTEQLTFIDEINKSNLNPSLITSYVPLPLVVPLRNTSTRTTNTRKIQLLEGEKITLSTVQNLLISKQNNYIGYNCFGGIEEICITLTGNVYSTVCGQNKPLANIFETTEFDLPTTPIICMRPNCWCEADLTVTKISPNEASFVGQNIIPIISI